MGKIDYSINKIASKADAINGAWVHPKVVKANKARARANKQRIRALRRAYATSNQLDKDLERLIR